MRREWLAVLVLALSCAPSRARMAGAKATADVKPESFDSAVDHWSRTQKVYQDMETKLIVSATWECGAFADAYSDEYARRYVLTDAAREEFRKHQESDSRSYQKFFVAAYTDDMHLNDLNRRDSIWRLRLYDDKGQSVEPLVISKVKDDDPIYHEFFPAFTPWARGYVVKFPKDGLSVDARTYKLQMTSPVGAAELEFERAGADRPATERAGTTTVGSAPALPAPGN